MFLRRVCKGLPSLPVSCVKKKYIYNSCHLLSSLTKKNYKTAGLLIYIGVVLLQSRRNIVEKFSNICILFSSFLHITQTLEGVTYDYTQD